MNKMYTTLFFFGFMLFLVLPLHVSAYEWGKHTVSDYIVVGIGCNLEPTDSCRVDDTLGLPEDTDCWINDNHKIILGATIPDDYNCKISLDAFFNGSAEADESIYISVNGMSKVWEDDDRGSGVSEVIIPGKFPFIEGSNEIAITHPMFNSECRDDVNHTDGDHVSGELNLGSIRIYDCTPRNAPVINNMGINPPVPNETVNIEFYGDYSDSEGDLNQRIIKCFRNSETEPVADCSQCIAGASLPFSCNISASQTSVGDTFICHITVYDEKGMKDEGSLTFGINQGVLNSPPVVHIISPTEGSFFHIYRNITCKGIATDNEDGLLAESSLSWTYIFKGTEKVFENDHQRIFTESWANLTVGRTGIYKIKLTAKDSAGAVASDSVSIHVYNPFSFVYIPIDYLEMIVGTSEFIKETLINDKATEDVFNMSLSGYPRAEFMTEGLQNLLSISPNKRSVSVRMMPFSSVNVFVKVFADDIGVFTLNQTSTSQNKQLLHSIRINSGYPPNFPEGGIVFVILLLIISIAVYTFFTKK